MLKPRTLHFVRFPISARKIHGSPPAFLRIPTEGIGGGPVDLNRNRTRLTDLLWRQRYAMGNVNHAGIPLPTPGSSIQAAAGIGNASSSDTDSIRRIPKRMRDSYCEVILPFSSDYQLREEYVNVYRGLRMGKLMEDLDALSASIAYKHCHDGRDGFLPLTIVTASMDRIDLLNPLRPDLDLRLHGHVTYVGKSSMEVTIRMESLGDPRSLDPIDHLQSKATQRQWTPICVCKSTMVARDQSTYAAAPVNPLVLETEQEKEIFALGERNKRHKLEAAKRDLEKEPPTPEERLIIHDLWLQHKKYENQHAMLDTTESLPAHIAFTEETQLQNVTICHPQERNIHSSIFGGYLMREAFELAYATAAIYLDARPLTLSSDDMAFRRPVPIGSMLFLNAQVVYAEGSPRTTFQVRVTAEIREMHSPQRELTNIFYYTFAPYASQANVLPKEHIPLEPVSVRPLIPRSYGQAMMYLQGRRRKERGIELKKQQLLDFERFSMPPS